MAAILCKSIASCIEGTCSCIGKICIGTLTLPCRICGVACDGIGSVCSSPFCLFVTASLIFNIPTISISVKELSSVSCSTGSLWLSICLFLCVVNILAAIYVSCRIISYDPNLRHLRRASSRAYYLFCHDPLMAIYLLLLMGYFIWLCVGISWIVSGKVEDEDDCPPSHDDDDDDIESEIWTAIGFGFAYFMFGSFAICCSCCLAQLDTRDYSSANTTTINNRVGNNNTDDLNHTPLLQQPQENVEVNNAEEIPIYSASGQAIVGAQQQQQQQQTEQQTPVAYAEVVPAASLPPSANPTYDHYREAKASASAPPEPIQ